MKLPRLMNAGHWALGVATVTAVVAAGAYGATVFAQRSIYLDGGGSTTCIPRDLITTDMTFGIHLFNESIDEVTLESIDFDSTPGLTVTEAWIATNDLQDDGTILGYGLMPYPPVGGHPGWQKRLPLAGATISHDDDVSIVIRVVIDPGADAASLRGANLHYSSPGALLGATAESDVQFSLDGAGEVSACDS